MNPQTNKAINIKANKNIFMMLGIWYVDLFHYSCFKTLLTILVLHGENKLL